jgi:nucleotide-binding universal stress UspA family protein/predicted transcriptional regulator
MAVSIVVPIIGPRADPDGISEQALPIARALADHTGGLVILVSVMEFMEEFSDLPDSAIDDHTIVVQRTDERRQYLEGIGESFGSSGVHVEVMQGDPSESILTLLQTVQRPVVVMTSRGHRGVRRLILGSVAFDVVQRAPCPVLVVPVTDVEPPESGIASMNRVLIPLDRTPQAEHAVDVAIDTLGAQSLTIRLAQVIPPLAQRSSRFAARHYATARAVALDYLGGIESRLRAHGHDVTSVVAIGSTEVEIAREAREFGADLIVMATRGRTGFSRMLFGSVAEGLVQLGNCPILVITPGTPAGRAVQAGTGAVEAQRERDRPLVLRRARDIMVSPVITASEDSSLESLARTMLDERIGCLPVVNDDGKLTGIVTESSFTGQERCPPFSLYRMPQLFGEWVPRAGIEQIYEAGRTLRARQIMSAPVMTATADEPVASVVAKMVRHDITSVPVVQDGSVIGIITRHDLLKMLAEESAVVISDDNGAPAT